MDKLFAFPVVLLSELSVFIVYLPIFFRLHIDGLVQERCNLSALAIELRLSCINPSIFDIGVIHRMIALVPMK